MRYVGRVVEWNDDCGFGFVVPNGGQDKVFLHAKSFGRGSRRPFDGALVSYEVVTDGRNRPQATSVRFVRMTSIRQPERLRLWWRSVLAVVALCVVVGEVRAGRLPGIFGGAYGVLSLLAFMAYGNDKSAARAGRWRTPENALLLLGLLGGWPGALLAQDAFRHKSSKAEFQVMFWITVVVNVVIVAWLVKTELRVVG